MGVDIKLYVKAKAGWSYTHGDFKSEPAPEYYEDCEATHEVWSAYRYYGPGYERGWWPQIAHTLLELFDDSDVEKIWYFGDYSDLEDQPEFTKADFLELTLHWLQNGGRPYQEGVRADTSYKPLLDQINAHYARLPDNESGTPETDDAKEVGKTTHEQS